MPFLADNGVGNLHQWFASASSRGTFERQLAARKSLSDYQAYGVSDLGVCGTDFLGIGACASLRSTIRGLLCNSFRALDNRCPRDAVVPAVHVASKESLGDKEQSNHQVKRQEKQQSSEVSLKGTSRKLALSHFQKQVDRACKILFNAGSWKPDVEEQLKRLRLDLEPRLVSDVLFRAKQRTGVAPEFLHWAKAQGYRTRPSDYVCLVSGVVNTGRFDVAQTLLEDMLHDGHPMEYSVFRGLLRGFASARRLNDALEVLNQMKFFECEPDLQLYSLVFGAIGRVAEVDLLALIRREVERWGQPSLRLNWFAWLLFKQGKWSDALTLHKEAIEQGWPLLATTYVFFIILLGKAGRGDDALDVYKDMISKSHSLAVAGQKLEVLGYKSLGLTEEVQKIMQRVKASKLSRAELNRWIYPLAKFGMVEEAVELYVEKRGRGVTLSSPRCIKKMLMVASQGVMSGICDMRVVECLWEDLRGGTEPDMPTCSYMINILGKVPEAGNLIREMFKLMRSRRLVIQDSQTCNTLIHRLAEGGHAEFALELWKGMIGRGLKCNPDSDKALIRCLLQQSRAPEARKVAARMKMSVRSDDTSVYEEVVEAVSEVGHLQDAENFAKEVAGGPDSTSGDQAKMYAAIMRGLNTAGKVDESLEIFHKLQKEGLETVALYNEALRALSSKGGADSLCALFEAMKQKGLAPDVDTYTALIAFLGHNDRVDQASRLFKEMKHIGCVPNAKTYEAIGSLPTEAFRRLMM